MKNRKLQTWKRNGNVIKVKTVERVVELKEDRSLFARLMMVLQESPIYWHQRGYRSLLVHGSPKGQYCIALEHVVAQPWESKRKVSTSSIGSSVVKVAIADGMAEVQSLEKPDWIKNCKDLAEHFIARLFVKYNNTQQIRLIFDRFYALSSRKSATRNKRQALKDSFTTISRIQLI